MDVFSLLKFWQNAGIGDPINPNDFDITEDDESSFFDLVFTNPNNLNDHDHYFSNSTPHSVFINSKRKISPLDSSSSSKSTIPKFPFRRVFQTNKPKVKDSKCEMEVTISSLLHRDNSLRHKLRSEKLMEHDCNNEHMPSKRFYKEVVNKYLNLIKPLYKRSNEKVRLTETVYSPLTGFAFSPRKEEKPLGKTVLKEVRKHLGKSRSSSSSSAVVKHVALRRDDSALQHDGIQSAILHCKKSYNSPSQGCVVLSRSGSAPSHGHRISVDEEKRISI